MSSDYTVTVTGDCTMCGGELMWFGAAIVCLGKLLDNKDDVELWEHYKATMG